MPEEKELQEREEQEEPSGEGGNPWGKRLLILLGILVILGVEIGVSYVVNKKMVIPKYFSQETTESEVPKETPVSRTAAHELNPNIYMLDNIVINPTGTNGGRYIAMSIGLGVDKRETLGVLENRDIQVRDAINTVLGNKGLREFVDVSYRGKLKREILGTINEKIQPAEVESIYFTEFVIQ